MTTGTALLLFSLGSVLRLDILAWLTAFVLFAVGFWYLWWQLQKWRQLTSDLSSLKRQNTHSIEYDLVLKAMKLTIWRIDIATRTLTYEIDYREGEDSLTSETGMSIDRLFTYVAPQHIQQVRKAMTDLMEGKTDELHEQYQMLLPHSSSYYWSESFATIDKRDDAGRPLVIVGTSMRIDRQKEIERQLIEARNQAQESDRLKTAFLANMSHEVRTPLNAIVGFSEVLPMAQSEEERNALINLINENNVQLLRLFDDMVSMSKLEAGGSAVKKTHFSLKPLLEEIRVKYEQEAAKKGLTLAIDPLPDDLQLYTDRDRLREILNQYVNNAVKFTASGGITLGCTQQGATLRIWVRDTGKGIPEALCNSQLFERFFKIDEFVPGTGLGLSICRSLAVSLGGTVGVVSTPGKGSTFWVDLELS